MAIACPADLDTLKLRAESSRFMRALRLSPPESFISIAGLSTRDATRVRRRGTSRRSRER